MKFSKLLLASAIAMSTSAFAMEDMTEDAMSSTTGQDGITIGMTANISTNIVLHDTDGYTGRTNSGAIVITGASLVTPSAINIVVDATGDANNDGTTTDAMLNVNITIPTGTVIHTGAISVADSNGVGIATDSSSSTIMNDMTITLGTTTANVQLGTEDQGAMIKLNTTMTGGLTLTGFALNDATPVTGSSISVASMVLSDAGFANNDLVVAADVDIVAAGLQVTVGTLGASGMDIAMTTVKLGTGTIGNVDILGLNLAGTVITIGGH